MRLISKWKDYFDYLVGIYGRDPTFVYDRRVLPMTKYNGYASDWVNDYRLHICGVMYTVFEYKGKLYHTGEELLALNKLLEERGLHGDTLYYVSKWYTKKTDAKKLYAAYNNILSDHNLEQRQPVLLAEVKLGTDPPEYRYTIPLLKSFNFHKAMSAEELYKKVIVFLGVLKDYPPITNNQTDLEKLQSHGFDKKISFRHRK